MLNKLFGIGKKIQESMQSSDDDSNQTTASQQTAPAQQFRETEYDPETLHGTHYTVEAFDNAVEEAIQNYLDDIDEEDQKRYNYETDVDNLRFNFRRDIYQQWNNCDSDQVIRWEHVNSMKHSGYATAGFTKEDSSNPFLQPVHGVDLKTYTAMCLKISSGVDYKDVCKAMGFEPVIWEELNTIWPQRMAEDTSFTVTTLFGQYYAEQPTIPQLENLHAAVSEEGAANLAKMREDKFFYFELEAARQAAYEYGLDGAQWIQDNFGISLGDFQSVAMKWMEDRNKNWDSNQINDEFAYREMKQKEYAARFAEEQGGNIADDVEF